MQWYFLAFKRCLRFVAGGRSLSIPFHFIFIGRARFSMGTGWKDWTAQVWSCGLYPLGAQNSFKPIANIDDRSFRCRDFTEPKKHELNLLSHNVSHGCTGCCFQFSMWNFHEIPRNWRRARTDESATYDILHFQIVQVQACPSRVKANVMILNVNEERKCIESLFLPD